MSEIPTVVVDPLPEGLDQVKPTISCKAKSPPPSATLSRLDYIVPLSQTCCFPFSGICHSRAILVMSFRLTTAENSLFTKEIGQPHARKGFCMLLSDCKFLCGSDFSRLLAAGLPSLKSTLCIFTMGTQIHGWHPGGLCPHGRAWPYLCQPSPALVRPLPYNETKRLEKVFQTYLFLLCKKDSPTGASCYSTNFMWRRTEVCKY